MNARELKMDDQALLRERDRQLAARRSRSSRLAPRKAPRLEKKQASRMERAAKVAAIRAEVVARADGDCECCGNPGSEMHHLVSGPARRRRESVETCAFLCRTCHHMWHANHFDVLLQLGEWATEHGYAEARSECVRRLERLRGPTARRDGDR